MKCLEEVSACAHDAGLDRSSTDIDAECQRFAGVGAERFFAHKVCELYPVCAILLSNMRMAAGCREDGRCCSGFTREVSRRNSIQPGDFRIVRAKPEESKAIRA